MVDSARLPVNWAQQSHVIAIHTAIGMQQVLRENSKSSQLPTLEHMNHETSTCSGNEVTETGKMPVHLKHGKTGPEGVSV